MKKSKLILTISSLAVVAAPVAAITSCNKNNSNSEIKIFTTENKLVGSEESGQLYFNLSKPLSDGQTLTVKDLTENIEWSFDSQAKTWNNIGVVNFAKTKACVEGQTSKINLRFTCSDSKSNSDLWSVDINDIQFVHSSAISLAAGQSKEDGWAEGKTESTYGSLSYTFDLAEALPENYELIVNLNQDTSKSSKDIYAASGTGLKPTISSDRKHATVTVAITKQAGSETEKPNYGEYAGFDLKFICNDEKKATFWSETISGFKLSYKAADVPVPINETNYHVEGNELKWIQIPDGNTYNVIEIPRAITTTNGIVSVTSVADDFWTNSVAKSGQDKMDKITVLRMLWSTESSARGCCPKYGQRAFKNSKITTIDVSAIPNSLKGLKTLLDIAADDGSGNGAFSGVPNDGSIKWNSEFTPYKKHIIKEKLYLAGVPNKWFGIVDVGSEEELVEHLDQGNSVKLTKDITLTQALNVYTGSILDLNGFTIGASKPIKNTISNQYALLTVWTNAALLINDTSTNKTGAITCPTSTDNSCFAVDVRCESSGDDNSTTLEITGGTFTGNSKVIQCKKSKVYIDGGTYQTNGTFTSSNLQQIWYDNMLYAVDDAGEVTKGFKSNFLVYAGKFMGKYILNSYSNFKVSGFNNNVAYNKRLWAKDDDEAQKVRDDGERTPLTQPVAGKEITVEPYEQEIATEFVAPTGTPLLDRDECYYDPFHTYSQPLRKSVTLADKKWWTSWYPNDSAYVVKVIYHPHGNDNINCVEVKYEAAQQ